MLNATIGFVGGLFFAAAFPAPSAAIRGMVAAGIAKLRAKVGL